MRRHRSEQNEQAGLSVSRLTVDLPSAAVFLQVVIGLCKRKETAALMIRAAVSNERIGRGQSSCLTDVDLFHGMIAFGLFAETLDFVR